MTLDYGNDIDIEDSEYIHENILSQESIISYELVNVDNETRFKDINAITSFPKSYVYKVIPGSRYLMIFEIKRCVAQQICNNCCNTGEIKFCRRGMTCTLGGTNIRDNHRCDCCWCSDPRIELGPSLL